MIRTENLSYKVDKKFLVKDVTLELRPQQINLIIGPNGAGKSTLLKMITGQVKSSSGSVFYDKKNLKDFKTAELAKKRALLSQNIELSFPFTVKEVVLMGRYPYFTHKPSQRDKEIVENCMELFGVEKFADRNYLSLSGGEKQRVQFARVVSQIISDDSKTERILALDEPLNALDIYYQLDFMNQLKKIIEKENILIVGVLHDLNLVAKYADQIIVLNHGELVNSGSSVDVLNAELIKKVYSVDVQIKKEDDHIHLLI